MRPINQDFHECNFDWLEEECPEPRTNTEIRSTWKKLDSLSRSSKIEDKAERKRFIKATGVCRRPVAGKLSLDMVHSVPYDPMHLLFLGLIKLHVRLLFMLHPKTDQSTPYVLPVSQQAVINDSLTEGATGIPSEWGRPPVSIANLSSFRAEDYKNFGMFYEPAPFEHTTAGKFVLQLWRYISDTLYIVWDPTPHRNECMELREIVQRVHALHTKLFFTRKDYEFCFTPTTQAILHLPDMMEENGPLLNVSQLLVERICGEISDFIGSMVRPEANLFNKTQLLFSLRLIRGGLGVDDDENGSKLTINDTQSKSPLVRNGCETSESLAHNTNKSEMNGWSTLYKLKGIPRKETDGRILKQLNEYICDVTNISCLNLKKFEAERYNRANILSGSKVVTFEKEENFKVRAKAQQARQKCWIAAQFDNEKSRDKHDSAASSQTVYYGCVTNIWKVLVWIDHINTVNPNFVFKVVRVRWQYGLSRNPITNTVSVLKGSGPRKGSVRDVYRTIESIECIDRLIGYFDCEKKRYFLDPMKRRIEQGQDLDLGGAL